MRDAFIVVTACCLLALVAGWTYFRRFRPALPPIGVFNAGDMLAMCVVVVLIPYVYLALPLWAVTVFLGAGFLSALYFTLEPVLRLPLLTGVMAASMVAADIGVALTQGVSSRPFQLLNNVVLMLVVVGATNLWAQSGMKARDVALLAAGLTVYDAIATWHLSVMGDLMERLSHIPLIPIMAWGSPGQDLTVGLGDLIIAAVLPLVMRKAFGRTAGILALAAGVIAIGTILALLAAGAVKGGVPAMVILGPLAVLQYFVWVRRKGVERTTWQYLLAEPTRRPG